MREFEKYCEGRKRLLEGQPIPATWVSEYQDAIAQKGRDAIWYLFAGTAWEEKMLFQCLADCIRILSPHLRWGTRWSRSFA